MPNESKPISLSPLNFEEALEALLKVKPEKKIKEKEQKKNKKSKEKKTRLI